jgi:hypothetical protein
MQREALIAALERLEFTADYYDAEIEDAKRVYKPHQIPGWESERARHESAVAQVKTALAAPAPEPVTYICLTAEEQAAMHKALGRSVKVVETSDTAALQERIAKLEAALNEIIARLPRGSLAAEVAEKSLEGS